MRFLVRNFELLFLAVREIHNVLPEAVAVAVALGKNTADEIRERGILILT